MQTSQQVPTRNSGIQQTRGTKVTRAVGIAVLAAALLVWFCRVYPPSLTGTFSHASDSTGAAMRLTLRPGGSGYLKWDNLPEEQIRWYADGDRLNVLNSGLAAMVMGVHSIAVRSGEDQSLLLDTGGGVRLEREQSAAQ